MNWQPDGWQPDGWQPETQSATVTPNPGDIVRVGVTPPISVKVNVKDLDIDKTYWIELFEPFVLEALRSIEFSAGEILRYPRDTGFYNVVTKGGRTARTYPIVIPRAANETFRDGSMDLVSRHPDDVSPPAIETIVWTPTAPLTVVSQSEAVHRASVTVSGGLAGESYPITARITPTVGDPLDVTLVVPVQQL